jgi:hypothetical protein
MSLSRQRASSEGTGRGPERGSPTYLRRRLIRKTLWLILARESHAIVDLLAGHVDSAPLTTGALDGRDKTSQDSDPLCERGDGDLRANCGRNSGR